MAGYTIFFDVSQYILQSLRDKLCPEYITSTDQIKLIAPTDQNTDYQVGLFMYDIQTMPEYLEGNMFQVGNDMMTYPSKSLKLRYMLFFNVKAAMPLKEEDQQVILGLVLQFFYDYATIDIKAIHHDWDERDLSASITVLNMNIDEKTKIWTGLDKSMQIALYLEVAPILLASGRYVPFKRVKEADFAAEEKERKG